MKPVIETLFLMPKQDYSYVSSSNVRENGREHRSVCSGAHFESPAWQVLLSFLVLA